MLFPPTYIPFLRTLTGLHDFQQTKSTGFCLQQPERNAEKHGLSLVMRTIIV